MGNLPTSITSLGLKHVADWQPELARLTGLRGLKCGDCRGMVSGWEHLPAAHITSLDLDWGFADLGALQQVSRLTALKQLSIKDVGDAESCLAHLATGLTSLEFVNCDDVTLPPSFARLTDLRWLSMRLPPTLGGFEHVPPGVTYLKLTTTYRGLLKTLPAHLSNLVALEELDLRGHAVKSGWEHLPRWLRSLDLSGGGLKALPEDLSRLDGLQTLTLTHNRILEGWEHLPRSLRSLDLSGGSLEALPEHLSCLDGLHTLTVAGNHIVDGWEHLPEGLTSLVLYRSNLAAVPPQLAGRQHLKILM